MRRSAVLGAVSGVIASLVMAIFAMIASVSYQGHGFFTPLYHIASVFISPMTLMTPMQDEVAGNGFYFSFGPAVLGVVVHMMVGAGYGAIVGMVASRLRIRGPVLLGAGIVWGAVVFLISSFIALPIAAKIFSSGEQITNMARLAGGGTFIVEHLLYGLVLGAPLMVRGRSAAPTSAA